MPFQFPEHWNAIDGMLIILLCVAIPTRQLLVSLRSIRQPVTSSMKTRAYRSVVMIGAPLALLTYVWWANERSAEALGLGFPSSASSQIGLGISVFIAAGMVLASNWPTNDQQRAEALGKIKAAGMLIETREDLALFTLQGILIGCGSELLFRGFLLWAFTPPFGMVGGIIVAGAAYGIGHGFRKWGDVIGILVSAFLFAIAFALTQSLWWLMLLHTALALNTGWMGYRLSRSETQVRIG